MKDDEEIVDAMRHPLAGDRCPACGAVLPPTGIGCGECAWMGEPLPDDAVRAPDTQAEADAAPLTHALDAEGNALCPYDPERLGYVSQRPERVTCPACMEAAAEPAPREPSAPNLHDQIRAASFVAPVCSACGANVAHWIDIGKRSAACNGCGAVKDYGAETSAPDELARLLRGSDGARLDDDIATVCNHAPEIWSGTREHVLRVARACYLLLAERMRVSAEKDRWKAIVHKACAHACEADETIVALRARVAELEAAPAGHRVAALLRAVEDAAKDAVEETDDRPDHVRTGRPFAYVEGLREAARLVREHLDAPSPEDFAKLPRLSDAEIQTALNKGRSEAFPAHHPFAAHLTAPSPLDLAAAEVCAVPATVAGWQEAYAEIDRLTDTDPEPGDALRSPTVVARRDLTRIARVALAGMLACDAKGGSK